MSINDFRRPLTVAEAAVALGCSIDTIRRWARQGRLRLYRVSGGLRVPVGEVERLLEGRETIETIA